MNPRKNLEGPSARSPDALSVPDWARRLSVVLDSAIRIPGTDVRVGLDPILGALLPELGDALTAVLSLSLLGVAFRQRVPKLVLSRMLLNIALDAILGAIPIVGDVFDVAFKSNEKNLSLIERHRGSRSGEATWGDRVFVFGIGLLALAVLLLPIALGVVFFRFLLRSVTAS